MTTPPEPAPKRETLAEFCQRPGWLPSDAVIAYRCGRSDNEIELRRRLGEHGAHVDSLQKLEKFVRERWPGWFLCEVRWVDGEIDHRPGWRSGQAVCVYLWAGFLSWLEREGADE